MHRQLMRILILFFSLDIHAAILKGGVLVNKKTNDYLVISCSNHNCDELSLDLYQNHTMTFSSPLPHLEEDFTAILFTMIAYRKTLSSLYNYSALAASILGASSVSYGTVYLILKKYGVFASISNPKIENFKQFTKLIFSTETRRLFMNQIRQVSSSGTYIKGFWGSLAVGFHIFKYISVSGRHSLFLNNKKRFENHLETLFGQKDSIEKRISQADFIVVNSILTRYSEMKNQEQIEEDDEVFETVLN